MSVQEGTSVWFRVHDSTFLTLTFATANFLAATVQMQSSSNLNADDTCETQIWFIIITKNSISLEWKIEEIIKSFLSYCGVDDELVKFIKKGSGLCFEVIKVSLKIKWRIWVQLITRWKKYIKTFIVCKQFSTCKNYDI